MTWWVDDSWCHKVVKNVITERNFHFRKIYLETPMIDDDDREVSLTELIGTWEGSTAALASCRAASPRCRAARPRAQCRAATSQPCHTEALHAGPPHRAAPCDRREARKAPLRLAGKWNRNYPVK